MGYDIEQQHKITYFDMSLFQLAGTDDHLQCVRLWIPSVRIGPPGPARLPFAFEIPIERQVFLP